MSSFLDILLFLSFFVPNVPISVHSAPPSPDYLWGVINSTLREARIPKYCPRIVFTDSTEFELGEGESTVNFGLWNIENLNSTDWDKGETKISTEIQELIAHHLEPCLIVVSIVLEPESESWLPWGRVAVEQEQRKHRELRHRLSDLFGYWTPIRSRYLVFARISDNVQDLNPCSKAPRYPIRPISLWEILLYDFFPEAKIIQSHGKELKVFKETGRWYWICEDTLLRLQGENYCKETRNQSEICQKYNFQGSWEWQLENRIKNHNQTTPICRLGYKARRL